MSVVTVVATAEESTGPGDPPRVRVDVTDTGTPAINAVNVVRLDADGRTVPVRTNDGNPLPLTTSGANRIGLVYDYEVPYGTSVSYSTLESPTQMSNAVTVAEDEVWLVHPGVPALSTPIELNRAALAEESFGVEQGVFWPMGRENPVVVNAGVRHGAQSSLVVAVATAGEIRAMRELARDAGTLFLNIPVSLGYLVDSAYIAVGEIRRARISDVGSDPHRNIVMPYWVVDRPAGGSQAERTYVNVLADNAAYPQLMTRYSSYTSLLAGP